ncbi:hypothetical protein OBBRIDRAFT_823282 [Obba rivulosa]|uniref:LYR motif-containing protein Cup1-like N-terminal domain-containing protein n=1 Tax=Obba rivulosa TaxID=1052685 RepID=A0A8E2DRV0_9APHY|nr:hypothetical protein OBBRIDRAFT_823282 [Obba rivulosa]
MSRDVIGLYRAGRRQSRLLPTEYLRQFFRLKLADDARAILSTTDEVSRARRMKRFQKELRKLNQANAGRARSFDHILNLAYGRKGKLRYELIEPLLSDPGAPPPGRIIPAEEKSRPPVYSPELQALVATSLSRPAKGLRPQNLNQPPTLPERADPTSEDARLLGPFSKRREVNIRWRYFASAWRKVLPPLQTTIVDKATGAVEVDKNHLAQSGVRSVGLQGTGVFEEAEQLARPPHQRLRPVSEDPQEPVADLKSTSGSLADTRPHPPQPVPRFLRRRFQLLLGRMPVLSYLKNPNSTPTKKSGKYEVTLSPHSNHPSERFPETFPEVDSASLAWIRQAEIHNEREKGAAKKQRQR